MKHNITSPEALDTRVAECVRLKIKLTQAVADKDAEVAAVEKRHTARITELQESIADVETQVLDYCAGNRAALFAEKKSRETSLAVFGFELTPPRVETSSRKIKWADVVDRLIRLPWGKAYLKVPAPTPDKNALLADREKLTPEQLTAAGVQFAQDEQFFLRPKPETAEDSVREAA
ncbi:MAG TPA: host-nuclease inhibitor Gam family protein [Chthonomonadales bacterium]|nr:host-nuclease inhibitor Gam family protein [Chthonomonadales bacterium]